MSTQPPGETTPLASCFYEGLVTHHRTSDPPHTFRQRVLYAYFDVEEIDAVFSLAPRIWSTSRIAPVRFRRSDYLGPADRSIGDAVRDIVLRESGERVTGRVMMLTTLRVWGWSFNPITCYFVQGVDGRTHHLVAEVTNTPWGERHVYVVGGPGEHRFDKDFHVSPFLPMDMTYTVRYQDPERHLSLSFDVAQGEQTILRAAMALTRVPLGRNVMIQMATRPWLGSPGFTFQIYRNALSLTRRGARFYRHPATKETQ